MSTLLLICSVAVAQETMSLDGTWNFALQKYGQNVPSALTDTIDVPSCWAVLGREEPVYRGFPGDKASTGYYSRTFDIPQSWKGRRVLLHFDGVWACASPVLNGHELGVHDSGYTSFAYDITDFLKISGNVLDVKVEQVSRYSKFDTNDDWTLGGIYRDVWLETMPGHRWLEMPVVTTTFDSKYCNASLRVKVVVADNHKSKVAGNFPSFGEDCQLAYSVKDADGREILSSAGGSGTVIRVQGQDATDKEIVKDFSVSRPVQWNAENPYLYTLTVSLLEKGKAVHSRSVRFGFRQIEIDNGGVFKINGVPVKLRGVNRHDEYPDVGRATRHGHWLEDLRKMKDNNINYIRSCHYAPAPGFLALCDSIGMYVSDEVSLGGGDEHFRDPSYAEGVLLRAYETVTRDINSPSVIFWTIGNEDPFTPVHLAACKLVKALDGSRPAAMPWRAEGWLPKEFDILAPHYWQPAQYDSLARASSRPIISTEYTHAYGTHAMGGLEARWKAITSHPNGAGAAVWMWQDQGILTPVLPEKPGKLSDNPYLRLDGQGWDGIVNSYRDTDSRDLQEVKSVYAQVFPAINKVKAGSKVRIPICNEYDFTSLDNTGIIWEQYADSACIAKGEAAVSAKPHSTKDLVLSISRPSGIYANYIILKFNRPDGSEITRSSIELETRPGLQQTGTADKFDSESLISRLRPVIWHRLDDTESSMYTSQERKLADSINFDSYRTEQISKSERIEDGERIISVRNRYTIDDHDSFTGDFEFRIGSGKIAVRYSLAPDVRLSWIPVYGMAYRADGIHDIEYVGLGPEDAYPNKNSAPIFGLWKYSGGIKSARSILVRLDDGTVRIDCRADSAAESSGGYIEVNPDRPSEILIIKEVVSRPEKGRKAVAPFPLNRTKEDSPFNGEFTITIN